MRKVHLYNPENDMALQRNGGDFTAPAAAADIAAAGAFLPAFYASENDLFIPNKYARRFEKSEIEIWQEEISAFLPFRALPVCGLDGIKAEPCPWGWSRAAAEIFAKAGLDESLIPERGRIERMRQLSHRRITVALSSELGKRCGYRVWTPFEARTLSEARGFMSQCDGKVIVKLPYSCSGRGVFSSTVFPEKKILELIERGILSHGSVMIERLHRRIKDFAVIVDYSWNNPEILFYSDFVTTEAGFYQGNIVAPDGFLRSEIVCLAGEEAVCETESALIPSLKEVLGRDYHGILGIDMLVAEDGPGRYINPVVELNLRHTTGYVAGMLARHYIAPGSRGYLVVGEKGESAANEAVTTDSGHIVGGRFCLTPGHGLSRGFILKVLKCN